MAEKRQRQKSRDSVGRIKKQVKAAAGSGRKGAKSGDDFWVRDDGALCWGNECVVINPDKNGDIEVEINRNRGCDVNAFANAVGETVSKGGRTVYRVKDD